MLCVVNMCKHIYQDQCLHHGLRIQERSLETWPLRIILSYGHIMNITHLIITSDTDTDTPKS